MDLKLIPLLLSYPDRTAEQVIEKLSLCVNHVFGYGHLTASFCQENGIDPEKLADDNSWHFHRGVLAHAFTQKIEAVVTWEANLTKDELKNIAKELKKDKK